MDVSEKLSVLSRIAWALNRRQVAWAVGGSLLLYFHGKVPAFHDIDLLTAEEDAAAVQETLCALGQLLPLRPPTSQYRTAYFREFVVDGVEVDVMAGLVIVKDGAPHRFPLLPKEIGPVVPVDGVQVPLHSLEAWRTYYALMGREEKARLISGGPL